MASVKAVDLDTAAVTGIFEIFNDKSEVKLTVIFICFTRGVPFGGGLYNQGIGPYGGYGAGGYGAGGYGGNYGYQNGYENSYGGGYGYGGGLGGLGGLGGIGGYPGGFYR